MDRGGNALDCRPAVYLSTLSDSTMTTIQSVETPVDILASLDTFNERAREYPERCMSIFRRTEYWVFHAQSEQFGPGKFVGYSGMTFDIYEQANQGTTTGAVFDGYVSRTAIEAALGNTFETDPAMNNALLVWAANLIGQDAFGGATPDKWKFVVLDLEAAEHGNEQDSAGTQKKPRNPDWQRDELILALDLYVRYGGKPPSHTHSDIVELSRVLNALPIHSNKGDSQTFRNENGVYLKLMNFRRFDPTQTGIGMTRGNRLEKEVWDQYSGKPEQLRILADSIRIGYLTVGEADTTEPEEETFPEGRILYRMHRLRERNRTVIEKAKTAEKKRAGRLRCCVCAFDFAEAYGLLGDDFIEGHHTKPLSELGGMTETKTTDIALVCSNCHRMLHRRSDLDVEGLRAVVNSRRETA